MTKNISKENYFYSMSKDNEPKLTVNIGDTVEIETHDCFTGQIVDEDISNFNGLDWEAINPATGPIYVDGIKKGDVLKVTINSIDISDTGVMVTGPGMGVMGEHLTDTTVRLFDVNKDKNTIYFKGLEVPMNKMIGVIGVAPEGDPVNNGTPDTHGGNMDSVKVTEGATLYLPVFVDGALFGLGDLHAAMGDGEISVSGLEVSGSVNVTLEKSENVTTRHPFLIDSDGAYMFVSDADLNKAVDQSVIEMIHLLEDKVPMTKEELTMLMSLIGQTEINQVVDPKKTARFKVPTYFLEKYNIKFN